MKLSDKGKRLLMEWEGFKTEVYKDSAGLKTIGVGHLLTQQELSLYEIALDDESRVNFHDGLTDDQVLSLLARDVRKFEQAMEQLVKVDLTQDQFDSLCSLIFNIGASNFARSTMLKMINVSEFDKASDEFQKWNRAGGHELPGLLKRRLAEAALFRGKVG